MTAPGWAAALAGRGEGRAGRARVYAGARAQLAAEGFVVLGPRTPAVPVDLTALPEEHRASLSGPDGRRVVLARSPVPEVSLHELAALAVLPDRRGRPPALRDLLRRPVDRLLVPLHARAELRLPCSGAVHRIQLDGPVLRLPAHPDADPVAERVLRALGGDLTVCVAVAADWPDRTAILSPGAEALRTLARARAWEGVGVAGRAADPLLAAWLTPEDAAAWAPRPLVEAALWCEAGVTRPVEATGWEEQGLTPPEAAEVRALGTDLRHLSDWRDAGLAPGVVALLRKAGVTGPDDLQRRRRAR